MRPTSEMVVENGPMGLEDVMKNFPLHQRLMEDDCLPLVSVFWLLCIFGLNI